jgi:hypothetical protein
MPNAAAIAAIQSRHRFELSQLHDAHVAQHDHLRRLHGEQRDREREEVRRRELTAPRRAGAHALHVRDDRADVDDRVKAHAELDAKQRQEREAVTARHTREIDAERTRPTSSAGPDRHSGPSGPGALAAVWHQLSTARQAEYHDVKGRYAEKRKALDERQNGEQRRHSRYDHERSASAAQGTREAEHRKINEAEERALDALRIKFEHELRMREQDRAR